MEKPLAERLEELHADIQKRPLFTAADREMFARNKNRCQDESDEQLKFNAIHN